MQGNGLSDDMLTVVVLIITLPVIIILIIWSALGYKFTENFLQNKVLYTSPTLDPSKTSHYIYIIETTYIYFK